MNPYAFLAKLLGIGLVAGTAVAMVKLVEKVWPKTDAEDGTFEYIAVAGEFPPEDEEAAGPTAGESAPDNADDCAAEADMAGDAADCTAEADAAGHTANCAAEADTADPANAPAQEPAATDALTATDAVSADAAPDAPNENPVDAPPAVPVTDPLKIAEPADFQNWDELGCQG